jgi:hypothetical protein
MFEDNASSGKRFLAKQLFHEAYEAQRAQDYVQAIELYKRSIEVHQLRKRTPSWLGL